MNEIETFLSERIAQVKATIIAYETAIATVQSDSRASYQIDTGQTRLLVTRQNLATAQSALQSQYNLLSVLDARVNGNAAYRSVPGW
jgi:hypothetical protein